MFEPQDLPGRYGRVVASVDRLLTATVCPAVLGGGWSVWRYGYVGRVTADLDVIVPADRVDELLRTAAVAGFDVLSRIEGHWPKLLHRQSGIEVDLLPSGGRLGTTARPALTLIPHPHALGAVGTFLHYIRLQRLMELKLASGRARDESDIVELVRATPDCIAMVRTHLTGIHPDYVREFDRLVQRARDQCEPL